MNTYQQNLADNDMPALPITHLLVEDANLPVTALAVPHRANGNTVLVRDIDGFTFRANKQSLRRVG
jgi:hypothetical protein